MTLDVLSLPICDSSRCEQCQVQGNRPVDVVAVHGLGETCTTAWTDTDTGVLWLRDLLPQDLHVARVLSFGYNVAISSFFGGSEVLEGIAETLVQNLESHRALDGGQQRPIIFICHGIGGTIVKKALVYSSTRIAPHVQHLYTVFVSTYAILLFGVPHDHLVKWKWLELESFLRHSKGLFKGRQSKGQDDQISEGQTLRMAEVAFAPLLKQFRIYFFWESAETTLGKVRDVMVDQSSAAPAIDNAERMAIPSDHLGMVKYASSSCQTYRSVLGALIRYCREASSLISHRWKLAEAHMSRARSNEAFELTGLVYDIQDTERTKDGAVTGIKAPKKQIDLPRRPFVYYVGRSGMSQVLEKAFFSSPGKLQKVFVLCGMGGAGKTEICIQFARDNQHRFSAIFTVQATSARHIKESYAKIGAYGGLEPTERSGKYWLEQSEEPWLLIVDNADDPHLDLSTILPLGDHGSILVTTRNPELRKHNTIGYRHVGGLCREEALALLLKSDNIRGPPWQPVVKITGHRITKALGYLALAVKAAGASIYRNVCKLHEYLDFHNDFRSRYHSLRDVEKNSRESEASVYSVFDISHRWLQNQESTAACDALEILNVVAFYHFEHIRLDVFTKAKGFRQESSSPAGRKSLLTRLSEFVVLRMAPPRALPGFLKDRHLSGPWRVREALALLSSLSMIFYDDEGDSFSLHPLVHAWIRDRMSTSEKALWASVALNILTDSIYLPSATGADDAGAYHRDILPHLDQSLGNFALWVKTGSSMLPNSRSSFVMILQPTLLLMVQEQVQDNAKCGYVYLNCGRFNDATEHLSAVCEALLHVLGPKNEKTMRAQLGLAQAYWGLGHLSKAIRLQNMVVEARKSVYGVEHCETLLAMDHLGRSYWLNGQYQEALHLQEYAVQKMKVQLAPDDSRLLAALDNLGVTLGAWHRYDESLNLHREVLQIRKKNYGSSDADTISTRMYMAMALLDVGQLQESQREMAEVYQLRRARLGKEHPWTLWALCYLAKINVKLGLLDEAEEMLLEGIAAGKRSLTDDHLGVLMGCGELARVYSRKGRLGEACSLLSETIERLKRSRGEHHPDYIYALWKMAQLQKKLGNFQEGAYHCKSALEQAKHRLTLDHPLSKLIALEKNNLESQKG
ncbi:uncharacterized protein A1O5_12044 [Cladophialophora psammophila CBS 110553]|uniref:NB-ARC domain-containing protein n=1 Tax=Cladophialophora psammophila CBS 110553 TaxID=1182543 RepID=W9VZJ1_9EURO|nr:uncharacterized protein A1O5_12044 [Cladophialophora psammophila CBS 110553]EXJ61252.1 hypothetical protein A1O5_12044 [Cladophialophora psammophila CBS 110553]